MEISLPPHKHTLASTSPGFLILVFFTSAALGVAPRPNPLGRDMNSIGSVNLHVRREWGGGNPP